MPYPSLWIQSLLLLSPHKSPLIETMQAQAEEKISGESTHSSSDSPFTFVQHFQQVTVTASPQASKPESLWPLTIQPAASFLQTVGNAFVTSTFPIQLNCILQAIICGTESAEFSWSLDGPYETTTLSTRIITSRPHAITWKPLGFFSRYHTSESLKVCRVKELVAFLAQEPGLYMITARLNEQEEAHLPLLIANMM